MSFILLMALHPEVQKAAQAEIDDVVGLGDAPRTEQLENLPYLLAILKEVLRYAPIANLGTCTRVPI